MPARTRRRLRPGGHALARARHQLIYSRLSFSAALLKNRRLKGEIRNLNLSNIFKHERFKNHEITIN